MTLNLNEVVVAPKWLSDHLNDVVVVDVRPHSEYREKGHIPGAVNIPIEALRDPGGVAEGMLPVASEFASHLEAAGITPEDTIVAYDNERGVYAARFLLTAAVYGHGGDLHLLDGEYSVWRQSFETETREPTVNPTDYQIDQSSSPLVVDRETVRQAEDSEAVLIDTRTSAEYETAHIPGAVHLSWETLVDEDTHQIRPPEEIETIREDLGISRDQDLILYCNTARRLSHTFAVLRDMGFESVRFYEGSLTDWIRAESPQWDPLHLYDRVKAVAPDGISALSRELGEDVFSRLHLVGLYTQKQDGYFMLRTKVPCGHLTAEQARTFGSVAREFATAPESHGGTDQNPEFGDGFLDITTRQGLQVHWIRPEDIPEIWNRFEEVGLTTIQASGNTLRNVVACPASGVGDEHVSVGPLGEQIAARFEGDRTLANLPRKLKISLSGCENNCARSEIQDIGFTPARKDDQNGFHVRVGGGLSDGPRVATDLGIFLEPDQLVEFTTSVARLFADHGSYLDTAVNRLRFLVSEWGIDRFRNELERYVDFEFTASGTDLTTGYRGDHVGVHRQSDGNYYVGLSVPTGRMAGADLIELADVAEEFGSGDLRTTPNQNVVLPNVSEGKLERLREHPILERYSPDPGPFTRGVVTCTGAEFCSYGLIEAKARGLQWARELDKWASESDTVEFPEGEPVRIHMSGCSASCAQPQIADIGLRGERHRDDGTEVPAVDVGLGGDLSRNQFIDWIVGSLSIEQIPDTIRRVLLAYNDERDEGESFSEWSDRHSTSELRTHLRDRASRVGATKKEVN